MSRIRTNLITNRMANGAPTVSNGLVISGVTTSTTFSGSGASLTNLPAAQLTGTLPAIDGSNLTNITSTTINNNGSNRIITGSSTANTLEGEATFTYDGVNKAKIDTSQTYAVLQLDGSSGGAIEFYDDATRKFEIYGIDAGIEIYDREKGSYHTKFLSGGNVEISDGKLLIGTSTKGYGDLDDLTIATSGNTGITIRSGTSSLGVIGFADGTSGNTQYRGVIQYRHSNDAMEFNTADAQRMRILGDGRVLINTSDGAAFSSRKLSVADTSSGATTAIEIRSATNGSGRLYFTDSVSSSDAGSYAGKVFYDHNTDYMGFYTGGGTNTPGERMKIDAYGRVTTPNQPSFAAGKSGNAYQLNSQVMPFDATRHNTGNHYNTSNYRFTAPVAGRYLFTFHSIIDGSINSGQQHYSIRINNSVSRGMNQHMTPNTNNWDQVSSSYILDLSANDYVTMFSDSNTRWHGNDWQLFCGQLLS